MTWFGKILIKFCKSFINLKMLYSTRTVHAALPGLDPTRSGLALVWRCDLVDCHPVPYGGKVISSFTKSRSWRVFPQAKMDEVLLELETLWLQLQMAMLVFDSPHTIWTVATVLSHTAGPEFETHSARAGWLVGLHDFQERVIPPCILI